MVAAVSQQFTASVMIIMYLVKGKSTSDRVYHASLAVLNLYAWTAVIIGWYAGVQKNIPKHGAYMHRLGAAWCAIVIGYRIMQTPIALWLGGDETANEWAEAIAGWLINSIFIGG